MVVLAVLGLLDDRRDLNPFLKLAVQLAVAGGALWLSGLRVTDLGLPFGGAHDLGAVGWLLAMVWLVGFTNIFNFMDGINGLAFMQLTIGGAAFCLMGVRDRRLRTGHRRRPGLGRGAGHAEVQLPAGPGLHGRRRQPALGLPAGDDGAARGLRRTRGRGTPWLAVLFVLWPFL